ncbi:carbon-nitrogen hydrolase family protein [Actinoplanes sp. NPDC049802]|uniref:carbon-nitrogen hydrolase family protein n=1 Tax=Actinoplanes sp. NPDC049802 TaxID=3154742 RepID=UPI0033C014A0
MSVLIAQVPTVWDVPTNLAAYREVMSEARPGDVVLFPEGLLSGYAEDLSPLRDLDPAEVRDAVARAADLARERAAHVFCGTLLPGERGWSNAAVHLSPDGPPRVYRKINLAMNERGPMIAGDRLETTAVHGVTAAVQLCREIRFPEQWQHLAAAGARFFVYLTNAANPREPSGVWRSHLISRAAENQRFVLSANIPSPDQHCPSMVVSPRGEVLAELPPGEKGLLRHTFDPAESGDWYLGQRRRDVLSVTYHTA